VWDFCTASLTRVNLNIRLSSVSTRRHTDRLGLAPGE